MNNQVTLGPTEKTARGFEIVKFRDIYDKYCSLQESSVATEAAVWLGQGRNKMHLNKEQVQALITHLNTWLDTGTLTPAQEGE